MSKTVVIIGGGSKSGAMLAQRFRSDGHRVLVLSHKPNSHAQSADFTNAHDVVDKFRRLTADVTCIDIFVYNTNMPTMPNSSNEFQGPLDRHRIDRYQADWAKAAVDTISLPHILTLAAIEKMQSHSIGAYLTTGLSYIDINHNWDYSQYVAYRGTKAVQNFIMLAFAHYNSAGATFLSLSPHYPYEDPQLLAAAVDRVYTALNLANRQHNGKIIPCFEPTLKM